MLPSLEENSIYIKITKLLSTHKFRYIEFQFLVVSTFGIFADALNCNVFQFLVVSTLIMRKKEGCGACFSFLSLVLLEHEVCREKDSVLVSCRQYIREYLEGKRIAPFVLVSCRQYNPRFFFAVFFYPVLVSCRQYNTRLHEWSLHTCFSFLSLVLHTMQDRKEIYSFSFLSLVPSQSYKSTCELMFQFLVVSTIQCMRAIVYIVCFSFLSLVHTKASNMACKRDVLVSCRQYQSRSQICR